MKKTIIYSKLNSYQEKYEIDKKLKNYKSLNSVMPIFDLNNEIEGFCTIIELILNQEISNIVVYNKEENSKILEILYALCIKYNIKIEQLNSNLFYLLIETFEVFNNYIEKMNDITKIKKFINNLENIK